MITYVSTNYQWYAQQIHVYTCYGILSSKYPYGILVLTCSYIHTHIDMIEKTPDSTYNVGQSGRFRSQLTRIITK